MEKVQLLKKMKHKWKPTKNEKTLLISLGIVIIFWTIFRFFITPQYSKLQKLTEKKYGYEEKISQINVILKKEEKIDKEWNDLHREKTILYNKYFSSLDQPQIILLLNEILDNENLDILDIRFERPSKEQIGDQTVEIMNIFIPFSTNYSGLLESIRGIKSSPKQIFISDLTMDTDKGNRLAGNISLKLYSLDESELGEDIVYINTITNGDKDSPFKTFGDYSEKDNEESTNDEVQDMEVEEGREYADDIELELNPEGYKKELLEDFENGNIYLIPSNKNINGNISKSTNSKSNKNSIRLEYNILAIEDENRAYVDLTDRNIYLKYPPTTIGLWVYSYGYSPATLGIRLKGQAGEEIDMELSKGIHWTGWEYVETTSPSDLSLYPLKIDKLYIELDYNRDDYGVVLFDKLEANYTKDSNMDSEFYKFYIVEKGDTLESISLRFYGTKNKKDIIMKYNELKADRDLKEGKILVIPR